MKSYISRKFPQETRSTRARFEAGAADFALTYDSMASGVAICTMAQTDVAYYQHMRGPRRFAAVPRLIGLALCAGVLATPTRADDIRVMTSGAFTGRRTRLSCRCSSASPGITSSRFMAPPSGTGPTTIPSRLERHESADIVILADASLDDLIARGLVVRGSRVDLVRSQIGMAVKAGAPRPDISTVAALKATLLRARTVGYSSSASGVYLTTELFPAPRHRRGN